MSTEAAANSPVAAPEADQIECASLPLPILPHSPPDSNNTHKSDASDSELSDLEDEPILSDAPAPAPASDPVQSEPQSDPVQQDDDIGEVLPDHWSGTVPVFKPTMHQFKDFKRFMTAVDSYGMKSGIIKIIPPEEWKESLPKIDDLVKQVKVREPIKQDIMGSNGTYRQVNILHGRSYNLPQWRQLCDQSEHQPPARRGERRANAEKPRPRTRAAASKAANPETPKKRGNGRPAKGRGRGKGKRKQEEAEEDRPMTPVSPNPETGETKDKPVDSIENDPGVEVDEEDPAPTVGRMGGSRQAKPKTQSVSARRKYSRREGSAMIDEAAFKDWDYKMDISEYTPERCEELERVYWKTLTYAPPLYGADLMGTLFHESTELWNLNKLPNLLDVLGTKVPGVNTAYLYLGMWKATFAWHLEDVDLYSINYLHFGAPKQWYSISQADARRFERAMKSIWPTDAKACDQFLRHKAFLISPQNLLQNYGIKVNKCLSYPGEFVVTYPYGYHSGYNLGYNCAEAVNFALDSWLEMGKIAKKCECAQAQDSVWVNVYEIERKLRGEETEYEETEDEEDEDDDEVSGLPTPPASHGVKFKDASRKRKRGPGEKNGKDQIKKIKLRIKAKAEPPCCLCPNDVPALELLPTEDGRKAHRMCALYLPETFIETVAGKEVVCNVMRIHKDRLNLKCLYCRSKRGACFQCSQARCARAYHPTCAAAAGVFVEEEEVPVFGEDGTEYKEQAFEFSCRFHRTKRDRKLDGEALEGDSRVQAAAAALKKGDICQLQYHKGEIFAGLVVENRHDDHSLLLDILPSGDRIEAEWKWLLLPDPADYHLPKASANAIPMPTTRRAKEMLNAKRHEDDKPRKDDQFVGSYTWAEFNSQEVHNKDQVKVDFSKQDQVWYYLGKTSTELRAQYTEDPSQARHNPNGNFLGTVPKPPKPPKPPRAAPKFDFQRQQMYGHVGTYNHQYPAMGSMGMATASTPGEKPYVYKPRQPVNPTPNASGVFKTQRFMPTMSHQPSHPPQPSGQMYSTFASASNNKYQSQPVYSSQRFEVRVSLNHNHQPSIQQPHPSSYNMARSSQNQWPGSNASPQSSFVAQHQQRLSQMASHPPPAPVQPRAQARPSWQVHSSIFQKYQFFQVHHNRDSTKYRTPYATYGGFTNGYEGNLRAHLVENKEDLLRRYHLISGPPVPQQTYATRIPASHQPLYNQAPTSIPQPPVNNPQSAARIPVSPVDKLPSTARIPPPPATPHSSPPARSTSQYPPSKSWSPPKPSTAPSHPHLPPAIKQQYLPAAQRSRPSVPMTPQEPKSKPAPVPRSYKIPPKESPVPLPANFLAAMTSSTRTPASAAKALSKTPGSNGSPATAQPMVSTPSTSQPLQAAMSSPKSGASSKISTTPVPVPKVLGLAQQPTAMQTPNHQAQKSPTPAQNSTAVASVSMRGPVLQLQTSQGDIKTSLSAQPLAGVVAHHQPQEFPDVPGSESMEFVERLMENLRRVSRRDSVA